MDDSRRMAFVNSISVEKGFEVSQADRLRLQTTPLHRCETILKKLVGKAYLVYSGSHHVSVIDNKGRVVLSVKEVGYF